MFNVERRIAKTPDAIAEESCRHDDQQYASAPASQIFQRTGRVFGPPGTDDEQSNDKVQ
nr:hypothetical protein [Sphingomonas turrisvirgatae]